MTPRSAARGGYDAVVVGAGPNGLAAAITLGRAGWSVLVAEANETIGGGCRSQELTLPGFVHDVCSAVHPLAIASPFLRTVPLADHGVVLDDPPLPLAHPLDGGIAVVMDRDMPLTAQALGSDGEAYAHLFSPLVRNATEIVEAVLGPPRLPRHPLAVLALARHGLRSAAGLATSTFRDEPARALHAGIAAHAMQPLDRPPTASVSLLLALLGHTYGWPVVRGGSQNLADALAAEARRLGCEIVTGWRVADIDELPPARAVLLDVTPRQVLEIAGQHLPSGYRRRLGKFRYGPGVFKLDWALDGPIPWTAEACGRAGTIHLGGGLAEIAAAEEAVTRGRIPSSPFVLMAQPTVADPTRAPAGKHTVWAYCHVPHGSDVDMTGAVEAQVERFAPGFRDRILGRSVLGPAAMERHDANYVGGDINGGLQDLRQLFTRPLVHWPPYATANPRLWMCSSSTPPGGGVHGACGAAAAEALLRRAPKLAGTSEPARARA